MKLSLLLLVVLFSSFTGARPLPVSQVIVYRHFHRAGTTMMLLSCFHHPGTCSDTSNVNTPSLITPADFSTLMDKAKRKKHHQTKVVGISFAGEMMINGKKHFYVFCQPYLLIDMTERVNYWLAPSDSISLASKIKQLPTLPSIQH